MILLAALLATQVQDRLAVLDAWKACVDGYASRYAHERDAADVVADGAIGNCRNEENAFRRMVKTYARESGVGSETEEFTDKEVNEQREALKRHAISIIVPKRMP